MRPNPQETANFVTFTEEILKLACVVKIILFFYGLILLEFDNTN